MLITFTGCDGAGKSTQVKYVKDWLENNGYRVEILDKWDVLDKEKFPEARFIDTPLDDFRVCISEMEGISRALFLFWTISITLTKDNLKDDNKIYILDGYWIKHAASEILYGCEESFIKSIYQQLPKSDLVLYFDITPEEALLRKKGDLTPYECGRDSELKEENFIKHQTKLRNLMDSWSQQYNWSRVSSLQSPEIITERVKEIITKKLLRG